jgi:DNA modification methylase
MTFLLGDCLEVMKLLPARSVDCFICDLPYGQLSNSTNKHKIKDFIVENDRTKPLNTYGNGCPWDVKIDIVTFWEQVKRLSKDDHTPVIMFCNTKFGNELINSNPKWFRHDLVWNKERGVSFLSANKMPMKSHEMIYIFSKKGAYYKRIDIKGEYKGWKATETLNTTRVYGATKDNKLTAMGNDGTTRVPLSVINLKKPNTLGHPTEKPIDLYKWILERYCPPGGTVLDPTAGSFNAIFAAKELGLKGIGIEKDRNFFYKGIIKLERIKRDTQQIPINTIELN